MRPEVEAEKADTMSKKELFARYFVMPNQHSTAFFQSAAGTGEPHPLEGLVPKADPTPEEGSSSDKGGDNE